MRWRDYVAIIAALMFISWLRSVWAPGVIVLVVSMLLIVLVGSFLRRLVLRRRLQRLQALSDVRQDAALDDLSNADAAVARLSLGITFRPERLAQLPAERRFAYRPGSRSLNAYFFWSCLLVALAMLIPFALGRFDEDNGPVVWIVLAGLLGACAWGYWRRAKNLGAELVVDREGVGIEGTAGKDCRVGWLEVAWVRSVGSPGSSYRALVLGTRLGTKLIIDSQVPEFEEATELVTAKLAAVRGTT